MTTSLSFMLGTAFLLITCSKSFSQTDLQDCPEPHRQRLLEYRDFHNQNKLSSDAQYLIQSCWSHSCAGTGDRIRGTMWVLRVAMVHRKILLVDWTQPAAITNFLVPNLVDWTFNGLDEATLRAPNTLDMMVYYDAVYRAVPGALEAFKQTKVHHVQTNVHIHDPAATLEPLEGDLIEIGACYYQLLFQMNATIVAKGEEHLRQLYPNLYQADPKGSYIAWHWRHFDADGEQEKPVLLSHLMSTLGCAQELGRTVGVDLHARPLLLISDFNIFRQFLLRGHMPLIITPNITARHIDQEVMEFELRAHGVNPVVGLDLFSDIFVDLYLMSRAACLVTSRSGFSKLALWAGSTPLRRCHRSMDLCKPSDFTH